MLDVRLGNPQQHEHLTIFPLLSATERELPYLLLMDAINTSLGEITEKGHGSVPSLIAHNKSDSEVLILDGEQLIGARQNRMTNRSILLPPKSETEIPVFCMEQGRWHTESPSMSSKKHHSPTKVRRHARKLEAQDAEVGNPVSYQALNRAQGEVWEEISMLSDALDAVSATRALDHLYDINANQIETWVRKFASTPDQVGLLAFVGEHPLGMDVIGGPALYAQVHERFLHGYVVDALTTPRTEVKPPTQESGETYLQQVQVAHRTSAPTVGAGRYAVLSGAVVGGELIDGDCVVHMSAFPREDVRDRHAPVAPPSRRKLR